MIDAHIFYITAEALNCPYKNTVYDCLAEVGLLYESSLNVLNKSASSCQVEISVSAEY